jgi:hypothetical protein
MILLGLETKDEALLSSFTIYTPNHRSGHICSILFSKTCLQAA